MVVDNVKKNFISGIIIAALSIIFTSIIWGRIYFKAIKCSNIKLEATTERLAETESRLAETNTIIEQCKFSLNDISDRISTNTGSLEKIIRNLEYISEKIQDMENYLNNCNYSNDYNDDFINFGGKKCQDIN